MKNIFILVSVILVISCTQKQVANKNQVIIEPYLNSKKLKPSSIIRFPDTLVKISDNEIKWSNQPLGVLIEINGHKINSSKSVTLNNVWGNDPDSVHYANSIKQVKYYSKEDLLLFLLNFEQCTGLGCSANYQLAYDLKRKKASFFGTFRTGSEIELYNFNNDNRPDYLSKSYYGRNIKGIDTTEFELFSLNSKGKFELFTNQKQRRYWFRHIYTEFQKDNLNEVFEESWVEFINKNGR